MRGFTTVEILAILFVVLVGGFLVVKSSAPTTEEAKAAKIRVIQKLNAQSLYDLDYPNDRYMTRY